MTSLTKKILREILSEKWVWEIGTPRRPKEPELKYRAIVSELENRKADKYYDEILFPIYHRFIRKLKGIIKDDRYNELHFEEIEGELWFGADCPECQSDVDMTIDRMLTRYVEEHPEWRQEYPTNEEIDSMITSKPTHQMSLL